MMLTIDRFCRDLQNDVFWQRIANEGSHYDTRHSEKNDIDLMDRLLTENHPTSSFESYEDMKEMIEETMMNNLDEINRQLSSNKPYILIEETFDDSQYQNPEDPYDFNTHHKGFKKDENGKIHEYDTNSIILVFNKDGDSVYGLSLRTAYPDLTKDTAKKTDRNIENIIKETSKYKNSTQIEKLKILNPEMRNKYNCEELNKITIPIQYQKNRKFNLSLETELIDGKEEIKTYVNSYRKQGNRWMQTRSNFNDINDRYYNDKIRTNKIDAEKPKIKEILRRNFRKDYNKMLDIKNKAKDLPEKKKRRSIGITIEKSLEKDKDFELE